MMASHALTSGTAATVTRSVTKEERLDRQLSSETVSWCGDILKRAGVVCITGATLGQEKRAAADEDHDKATKSALEDLTTMWNGIHPHIEKFQTSWEGVLWETIGRNCFSEVAPRGKRRFDMHLLLPEQKQAQKKSQHANISPRSLSDNPLVRQLMQNMLGKDCEQFMAGCIVALPGAINQPAHIDSGHLFPPSATSGTILPMHEATVCIPPLDLTPDTGCTAFALGSHITHAAGKEPDEEAYIPLYCPAGSVVIWDVRTHHKGLGNRSDITRPLFYSSWCVNWFKQTGYFGGRSLVREMQSLQMEEGATSVHSEAAAGAAIGAAAEAEGQAATATSTTLACATPGRDTLPALTPARRQLFERFVATHAAQLLQLKVPEKLWAPLFFKLCGGVEGVDAAVGVVEAAAAGAPGDGAYEPPLPILDAGQAFQLGWEEEEEEEEEEKNGEGGRYVVLAVAALDPSTSTSSTSASSASTTSTTSSIGSGDGIWLVNHPWTFEGGVEAAEWQLANNQQLRSLVHNTLLPGEPEPEAGTGQEGAKQHVTRLMPLLQRTLATYDSSTTTEGDSTRYYMMDSIGAHLTRISKSDGDAVDKDATTEEAVAPSANAVLSRPFLFQDIRPAAAAVPVIPYSLLWICEPCDEGETITITH